MKGTLIVELEDHICRNITIATDYLCAEQYRCDPVMFFFVVGEKGSRGPQGQPGRPGFTGRRGVDGSLGGPGEIGPQVC